MRPNLFVPIVSKPALFKLIPEFCTKIAIYKVRDQFTVIDSERGSLF